MSSARGKAAVLLAAAGLRARALLEAPLPGDGSESSDAHHKTQPTVG